MIWRRFGPQMRCRLFIMVVCCSTMRWRLFHKCPYRAGNSEPISWQQLLTFMHRPMMMGWEIRVNCEDVEPQIGGRSDSLLIKLSRRGWIAVIIILFAITQFLTFNWNNSNLSRSPWPPFVAFSCECLSFFVAHIVLWGPPCWMARRCRPYYWIAFSIQNRIRIFGGNLNLNKAPSDFA